MKNLVLVGLLVAMVSGCASDDSSGLVAAPADRAKQVDALVQLGVGYLKTGEYARAKDNLNKALRLDSHSAAAHNALALVFQLEQEYDQAAIQFKLALRYKPTFTRARNNYGAFLFSQGKYQDAIEQLKIATGDQYYDERPTVFENLGISYLKINDKQAAEDAFIHSVALNPKQPRALLELAELRFDQKQYVPSRDLFRRFEAVSRDDARSLWLCVRLSAVFGDSNKEASCAIALKNLYPVSEEYKEYRKMFTQ